MSDQEVVQALARVLWQNMTFSQAVQILEVNVAGSAQQQFDDMSEDERKQLKEKLSPEDKPKIYIP